MEAKGISAIFLAHPKDEAIALELGRILRTEIPNFEFQINNALGSGRLVEKAAGPFILLISQNLLTSGDYLANEIHFEVAALNGHLLSVQIDPWITAHPFPKHQFIQVNVPDLGRNITPARRIARWIRTNSPRPSRDRYEILESDVLKEPVTALIMPTRAKTLLKKAGFVYVGELVQVTEASLLRKVGIGRETLTDIKAALADRGLHLGMDISPLEGVKPDLLHPENPVVAKVADLEQTEGGATFEADGDHFAIVTSSSESDATIAAKQVMRQLQEASSAKALSFAEEAKRLDNQPGWAGIGKTASELARLLGHPAEEIGDLLGLVYAASLEMWSFIEFDDKLVQGSSSNALPLDPEVRRPLDNLMRTVVPWLKSFPAIREWDEHNSNFLVKYPELETTMEVLAAAREHLLIAEDSAEVLQGLCEAAERGDLQGSKAGGVANRSTINLVIAAATKAAANLYLGAVIGVWSTTSPLVMASASFLTSSEAEISMLLSSMPEMRYAIGAFVKEVERNPPIPAQPPRPITDPAVRRRENEASGDE